MGNEAAVYVGTYAKYNDGNLFGAWLKLDDYSDKEDFIEACLELHEDEEDPELMFQDWENIPDKYIGECFISEDYWTEYAEIDESDREAFAIYVDWRGSDYATKDDFEECYCGKWDSEIDYAENLVEECGYLSEMPENLRYYFDYEKFARDLFFDYTFIDGHVFRNC